MNVHHSEELIKEYHRELRVSGFASSDAARRRDRLRFFLHAYLNPEWPRNLDRVDGEIVRDFLGAWFLRHVGGAKTDLVSWLNTFRHFYSYLYNTGNIAAPEYEDLEMVLENENYFLHRHDDYFNPVLDGLDEWERCRRPPAEADILWGNYRGVIDRQLWVLITNLEHPPAPAVLDFNLFLDYVQGYNIKLDRSRRRFPKKHLQRLNQRFSQPEELEAGADMDASRRLTWFFHLALKLELTRVNDSGELVLTPQAEAFLDLDPNSQLAVIIDGTWNAVAWPDVGSQDMRQVSEWAQKHRDGFAALLADISPHRQCNLDPDSELDRNDVLLARYIYFHEVVENIVLFALEQTGVVTLTRWNDPADRTLAIKSISSTRFGRHIMKLYANRAFQAAPPAASPLQRLQQSLLSY